MIAHTPSIPLVSILMTSYNREAFIGEAIESVLECEYSNVEFIIVDDCSTDNTYEIAKSLTDNFSHVKLLRNDVNLGQFSNRNKAASYATGYYLMHVDSDDKLYNGVVTKCVDAMSRFSNNNFGMYYRDANLTEAFYLDEVSAFRKNYFEQPFLGIGPGSTIIKRTFFNDIGGYTDKYGAVGDMYFNLKACRGSGIILMPWDFVYYRLHEQQELNNPFSYLFNTYRYLNDALKEIEMPLTKKEIEWLDKKNKRRFVTNILAHFKKSRNLSSTYTAIKNAGFTVPDFFKGVFH